MGLDQLFTHGCALVVLEVTDQLSSRCRLSINAEQVARNGESDF